jgi:hypothetical protein
VPSHELVSAPREPLREEWEAVLDSSDESLAFHSPAWVDAIVATGGWTNATRLFETRSGGRLLVPMVERNRFALGRGRRASLPYGWGFGGIVASPQVTNEEFRAVVERLGDGAGTTTVRPNPLTAERWAASVPRTTETLPRAAHVLELDGGFEHVFANRFKGRARTAVRKAERAGVTVELGTHGRLVPVFYDLYRKSLVRWAKRRRLPTAIVRRVGEARDPLRKFEAVAAQLGGACRLWVAAVDEHPVAAVICLVRGRNASYWRGCIDEERAAKTYASYLLQKQAIEDACMLGCANYHMGETGSAPGLTQFKEGFGARLHGYDEFRFGSHARMQRLARIRPGAPSRPSPRERPS